MTDTNPRAAPGDNRPPADAQHVTDRMAADYAATKERLESLIAEAGELPAECLDKQDEAKISAHVVRLRNARKDWEGARIAEKDPYLAAERAIDSFFGLLRERLDRTGAALTKIVDAYKQRQLAEERERRRKEAEEARRREQEAQRQRDEAERKRREAEDKADRARKAIIQERHEIEAVEHAAREEAARVEQMIARDEAEVAETSAAQSPSQMTRQRFNTGDVGGMSTMGKREQVEITDVSLLDLEKLRPHIREDHLLMALRSWARATGFRQEMPGAIVAKRATTVIR